MFLCCKVACISVQFDNQIKIIMKAIIVLAVLVAQVMAQTCQDLNRVCQNSGELTGDGTTLEECPCDCTDTGFYGDECENQCSAVQNGLCRTCGNNGVCTDATCETGYTHDNGACNVQDCTKTSDPQEAIDDPSKIVCQNGQAEGQTGTCQCNCAYSQFHGDICNIPCTTPDNADDCADCTDDDVCNSAVCKTGFEEKNDSPGVCEPKDCSVGGDTNDPSQKNCQNGAAATGKAGSCQCICTDTGYYGDLCDTECTAPDNANSCQDCTDGNGCNKADCRLGFNHDSGSCTPVPCTQAIGNDFDDDASQIACTAGTPTGTSGSCTCDCDNTGRHGTHCDIPCILPNNAQNCLTCDDQGTCTDAQCKPGFAHNSGSCNSVICTQATDDNEASTDDSKILCENDGTVLGTSPNCACDCDETGHYGSYCDAACVSLQHGECITCTGSSLGQCEDATCHDTYVAYFEDNVFQGCLPEETCSTCLTTLSCHLKHDDQTFCAPGKTEASGGSCASGICSQDDCCATETCGENEYVSNHACVSCPEFQHRQAGDDPTGEDTQCDLNTHCHLYSPDFLCSTTELPAPKPFIMSEPDYCTTNGACTSEECCTQPRSCNDDYTDDYSGLDCSTRPDSLDKTENVQTMFDLYNTEPPKKNKDDLDTPVEETTKYNIASRKVDLKHCCEYHEICGDTFSKVCGTLEHDKSKIYKACPATGCSASECCIPASSPEKFSVVFAGDFTTNTAEKIIVKIPSSRQGDFNVGDKITYVNQADGSEYETEVTEITQVTTTPAASGGSRRRRDDEDVFLEISINPGLKTNVNTGEGTIVESKTILQQEAAKKSSKTKAKTSDKNSMNDGEKFALVLGIGAGFLFLLSFFNE